MKILLVIILFAASVAISFVSMALLYSFKKNNSIKLSLYVSLVGLLLLMSYLLGTVISSQIEDNKTVIIQNINDPTELLYSLECNEDNFKMVCKYYKVKHVDEVYNQALLETGHFTSYNFRERNNTLGLTGPTGYYEFEHWTQSILGYVNMVQYKLREGEDYYEFLKRIGYAEDPNYINKLKQLNNKANDTK